MTIKREQSETFHASSEKVVEAIRSALANGEASYHYHDAVEAKDHLGFSAVVRPSWWPLLASTKMAIRLDPNNSQTRVTVETRSQWLVVGDIFNVYNGYIRDVLGAIRPRVKGHA